MKKIDFLTIAEDPVLLSRRESIESLHAEDQQEYKAHPTSSLTKVLSRKLRIPESIKALILCTHERIDQKGFPSAYLFS